LQSEVAVRKQAEEKLRETNDYLENLFNHANAPIIVWDPQFRITRFNGAFEALSGRRACEVVGKSLALLFPPALVESSMELIEKTTAGERWETVEIAILHLDGSVRTVLWNSATLLAADGKTPVATIAQGQDITDRKLMELAVRTSEEQFRTMANSIPQLAWIARADGYIFWYNQRWYEYTGTTPEQMEGWGWQSVHDPDVLPQVMHSWTGAIASGKPFEMQFPLRGTDGQFHTFLTRVQPLRDASGQIVQWFGTNTDIEPLKQAETALRQHRDHLEQLVEARTAEVRSANAYNRGLIEASLDPLLTKGRDGRITDVNRATEAITGRSRQELIGTDFADYFTEPERARAAYQEAFREGTVRDYELALRHTDGSIHPVLYNAAVYRDQAGMVVGVFAAMHDITERKRAEEALRTLNSDLADRSAELEAVNRELEAFSYSVSHDLKAPLRSVDGFAKMLEEDYASRLDDEGRRLLRVVRDSARDMGQLVNDLLTFSRLSRKDLKMMPIKMRDVAQDARRQVEMVAAGRTIRWDIGELPPAFGDEATIREVLINLFSNAVKFTRPRQVATIAIDGRVEGEEVRYTVTDNGVGFDMAYQDKLFCVFQRLHTSDQFEGTGIGLALVQRIVQRHGGRVWAEGKVNEGATFGFTLPRKDERGRHGAHASIETETRQ